MSRTSRLMVSLVIIVVLGLVDQWSKWHVIERIFRPVSFDAQGPSVGFAQWLTTLGQEQFPFYRMEVTSFFNLVMVWNKGVSFGMFASNHTWMPIALMVMALALSSLFVYWLWRSKSLLEALPLALVISGAISNVWDRARFGAVADFLDVHVAGYHWPSFNIADSSIVVGVAGLALYTLLSPEKRAEPSQDVA